jgi:hypothetical protein
VFKLTIDDLPDDVLLVIFDFYVVRYQDLDFRVSSDYMTKRKIESWQPLVHVCRRWRCLVFGSPRCLNLQLCCYTPERSTRKSLDVWPALPLLIEGDVYKESVDAAIALEHSDRILRQININCHPIPQVETLWTAMQVPFPELAGLYLSFKWFLYGPFLPDSFLGGSAPRLRYLCLDRIQFPGLPKLLLSATHLVHLYLHHIPYYEYISPDAMAACLSSTSLERLLLEFDPQISPRSYLDLKRRRPFPPTRSVLPTLMNFSFKGVNEYLEEFVARINAPALYQLSTTFFHDGDLKAPELSQFINRTPTLGAYDEARLIFLRYDGLVRLRQSHPERSDHGMVEVKIISNEPRQQLLFLAQICTLSLRLLLITEDLYIVGERSPLLLSWDENTELLGLLLPFTAVKNLYLCHSFTPRIVDALQELTGGRITEVLPALQNVLLEEYPPWEPLEKGIAEFISARQLINHPVAFSVWDRS